ncbi:MAG: hypothetical protein R3325_08800 [Thermoanaerobaculia bacterium]|nr:hypothetical protein [Thermoanaerobaculia bacterium]
MRLYRRWHLVIFAAGLALSALMAARSQVTVDQYNLLARGWRLVSEGELVPFGVWATGGGQHPGVVTSLLVGLPLFVWEHHRAPVLLIVASHVAAYLLLFVTLRRVLNPVELLLFAVLYWLGPWRVFFSGFLWNPNLLFFFGAVHLATAHGLRRRPRLGLSFLHIASLGIAAQLHMSAGLLIAATGLLWWRRHLRLHLGGVALAAGAVALTLVPWARAMVAEPSRLPASESGIGHGIVTGVPILQGVMNWLRFGGPGMNRSMACLDFSGLGGPALDAVGWVQGPLRLLVVPTLLFALWANARLWRRSEGRWTVFAGEGEEREWLGNFLRWSFAGAVVVFALSPVDVTGHGLLSQVHVAVLPVALGAAALLEGRSPGTTHRFAGGVALLSVALGAAMALGSPAYRCGAPLCDSTQLTVPTLIADHPMLDDLGIRATCPPVVDDARGWWPDGLPLPSGWETDDPSHRLDAEFREPSAPAAE